MTAGAPHGIPGTEAGDGELASRRDDQTATVTWFAVAPTADATHVTETGPGAASGWRDAAAPLTVTAPAVIRTGGATRGVHVTEAGAGVASIQRDGTTIVPLPRALMVTGVTHGAHVTEDGGEAANRHNTVTQS